MVKILLEEIVPDAYPVIWERDELDRVIITSPDWPELCIVGDEISLALMQAADRVRLLLARRRDQDWPVPYASTAESLEGKNITGQSGVEWVATNIPVQLLEAEEDG